MLILLTWPELTEELVDNILDRILEGATAEEILEEFGLEDREERFLRTKDLLNEISPEKWGEL